MEKHTLTLGSLFDGSGGFPLGGLLCGIQPVWASEIEPFPILVTTKRLPFVKHYGNILYMSGSEIEPVDIITFGSPCTDLSIAGKRAGLEGKQSSLFYEAIRIITEMRCATNGKYPRWICWENVKGVFTSKKGEDFRAVLEAIIHIAEPDAKVPPPAKNKWPYADCYMGDGWSVAYRTFDAQYWGVPQRRKRIYLVADFGGECAGKVLFESEGVSRYSAKGFRAWQKAASAVRTGITKTSEFCLNAQDGYDMDIVHRIGVDLHTESHHHPLNVQNKQEIPISKQNYSFLENQTFHSSNQTNLLSPYVLKKAYGICSKKSNSMKSQNPYSGIYTTDISHTLDATGENPSCNQGGIMILSLQGSMIGRKDKNGPGGSGVNENISFTLNATDIHAITAPIYATSKNTLHTIAEINMSDTLETTDYKDPPHMVDQDDSKEPQYIVRRLTPNECARLQGFPAWWCSHLHLDNPSDTEIEKWRVIFQEYAMNKKQKIAKPKTSYQIKKWLQAPYSDSAAYKMWGNGVSLPCVVFILAGIQWASEEN